MATWKKVIVSGSTANLAALQVDNLTSGQVVIGGGASNLSTTAINGTGNIVATTGATGVAMTGSFTGSFAGNFVGTTNLPDLTQGTGITAFTYDGSTTATVSLKNAGSLTNNVLQKWDSGNGQFTNASLTDNGTTISGATSLQLTGASSILTGSFTGSFAGNGAGLTGVTATAIFPTTAKTDLASTDQFFINDSTNKFVTYGNLLTDLAGTNLAVEGTDSLTLASTITGLTSVTSTTFVGNLTGTATTASNITPAITNNTDNRVLTATGGGTINGEGNLTFDGTTLTVTGNEIITGNLIVQGTASFQQTTNLEVADRFVLFASGSNSAGDGGIVVQQATQNVGELYGFENAANRWGFTSSFDASSPSFTPSAYITTTEFSATTPSAAPIYGGASNGYGNIHVNTATGDIFIYS
jgi:hypothetical protein